jgi:hypothetical protein
MRYGSRCQAHMFVSTTATLLGFSRSTVSCVSTTQRTSRQLDPTVGSIGVNRGQHPCGTLSTPCRVHAHSDWKIRWPIYIFLDTPSAFSVCHKRLLIADQRKPSPHFKKAISQFEALNSATFSQSIVQLHYNPRTTSLKWCKGHSWTFCSGNSTCKFLGKWSALHSQSKHFQWVWYSGSVWPDYKTTDRITQGHFCRTRSSIPLWFESTEQSM